MKVLIYGAGAVGRYLAVRLAKSDEDISLIDRFYFKEIEDNGLTLVSPRGFFSVKKVRLFKNLEELKKENLDFDYVFFAVKSFDLESALNETSKLFKNSKILIFQNGIGNEELAFKFYPRARIISATLTSAVELDNAGRIITAEKGGIGLAGINIAPDKGLISAFMEAGFNTGVYHSYREMKWSKLILNIIGNATSSILGMPPEEVFKDRRMFIIEVSALREIIDLMKKQGIKVINLPGFPVRILAVMVKIFSPAILQIILAKKFSGGRGGKFPSLYIDLERKKISSEIDCLNGVVLAYQGNFPANMTLTKIFKGMLEGTVSRSDFYKAPDRLWEEYEKSVGLK